MKYGNLTVAGLMMMIAGALHISALFFGRFDPWTLAFGLIIFALGFLLTRGWSRLAWPAFLLSAFGVAGAVVHVFSPGGWVFWLIIFADFIASIAGFIYIWQNGRVRA